MAAMFGGKMRVPLPVTAQLEFSLESPEADSPREAILKIVPSAVVLELENGAEVAIPLAQFVKEA